MIFDDFLVVHVFLQRLILKKIQKLFLKVFGIK